MTEKRNQSTSRRSVIRSGAALAGSFILTAPFVPANAQQTPQADQGPVYDVRKFGATGKRKDNDTKAFRDAVNACFSGGGGIVHVPPGEYTVGTIQLKDNTTLNIEAGATLFMSQLKTDFLPGSRAMIYAEKAKNITVTGRGTLDGLAQYDYTEMRGLDVDISKEIELARAAGMDMRRYYRKDTALNAFMFIINDCVNFLLSNVTIIHSPLWTVRLNDCDRIFIRGVYIYSDLEKGVNADGIDICSSSNVIISDCVIETADDAIVLKTISRNGLKAKPCENITVTNCILTSSSTPLMIGTETEADIRHVLFTNCVLRNSNKGFGINVQDGATVSDVVFSNLTIDTSRRHWNWWGNAEMCKIILHKRKNTSPLGIIKNIVIDNVIAHVRGTSTITGFADQSIENITMSNVQVFMIPEDSKDKRSSDAMQIENVKGLTLRNVSVNWSEEAEEKWLSALTIKRVTDFTIDSFSGRQGSLKNAGAAISLENVSDGSIRNSRAARDADTFIYIKGNDSQDIDLQNNNTRKARQAISFENEALRKRILGNGASGAI